MICNGVQIVEAKKADLDIALIEIHPESKNYVFSLSRFQSPSFVVSNLLGTFFDIVKVISRYLRVEGNSW